VKESKISPQWNFRFIERLRELKKGCKRLNLTRFEGKNIKPRFFVNVKYFYQGAMNDWGAKSAKIH